jgi:hypothetical protein
MDAGEYVILSMDANAPTDLSKLLGTRRKLLRIELHGSGHLGSAMLSLHKDGKDKGAPFVKKTGIVREVVFPEEEFIIDGHISCYMLISPGVMKTDILRLHFSAPL